MNNLLEENRELAIIVSGVGKCYEPYIYGQLRILPAKILNNVKASGRRAFARLKGHKIPKPGKTKVNGFWASKNITFDVHRGEVLGIIGRNGSGKTTLLKMISRVTHPTTGEIEIRGKMAALLGVGTGFHPMFTGKENIFMGGMILGLSRQEIEKRYDDIVEFSEIGEFINQPVKTYSTGMRARLGFAVAVQLNPEILLLDEVLAVGDAGFQRKCLNEIVNMRKQGRTILFVSHNTNAIKAYCDRCILLEKGEIVKDGDPSDVISYYLSNMFERGRSNKVGDKSDREGSGIIQIDEFWLEDALGRVVGNAISGETSTLCLQYACSVPNEIQSLSIGVAICDSGGKWLFRLSTEVTDNDFDSVPNNGVFRCDISKLPLISGEYGFGYRITSKGEVADYVVDAGKFDVSEGDFFGTGKLDSHSPLLVEHRWSISENKKSTIE